jgi:hypothetical protein
VTTLKARASKRWITLWAYIGIWLLVGPGLAQWDVFQYMSIPMISLGVAYIIGESWKPTLGERVDRQATEAEA